jgi:hypothetical protein
MSDVCDPDKLNNNSKCDSLTSADDKAETGTAAICEEGKSETGTYTIDNDEQSSNSVDLKIERDNIDAVFGIQDKKESTDWVSHWASSMLVCTSRTDMVNTRKKHF